MGACVVLVAPARSHPAFQVYRPGNLQVLDHQMKTLELATGVPAGRIGVLAVATEAAAPCAAWTRRRHAADRRPVAGMDMFKQAKGGGVFNDYHDDGNRWTEEQARDVAEHIIRRSQLDAKFVKTALARLAIL